MKISKTSWHYKLNLLARNEITGDLHSKNFKPTLCRYFWATLMSVLVLVFKGFAALLAIFGAVCMFWLIFGNTFMTLFSLYTGVGLDYTAHDLGFAMIGVICLIILGVGTESFLKSEINFWPEWFPVGKWVNKLRNKTNKIKESKPSLVVEYIKAKKSKVCPLLELED